MILQSIVMALIMSPSMGYNSPQNTVYDFTVKDIDGNDVPLSKYRGMVLVIVNLASECGLTDRNYKELVILQKELGFRGFRVLGFPSDQFAGQELETNEQIKTFARETYSINFDLFAKINVNGAEAEPLWRFLKERQGGIIYSGIKWNFTKFLIDRNGIPVDRFSPTTPPLSMKDDIVKYLNRTAKADAPETMNQNNTEL
ncbi:glutathione peroxidase [Galendromus occidentalis]|uniref:Glutathione peroxidase n=1 Tax=Galendromus occidentalis TaxID=34638 RepID=A0AAJ6QT43_9ACAR|nr:glutathione peroxidase [Galendromus occidentalis]